MQPRVGQDEAQCRAGTDQPAVEIGALPVLAAKNCCDGHSFNDQLLAHALGAVAGDGVGDQFIERWVVGQLFLLQNLLVGGKAHAGLLTGRDELQLATARDGYVLAGRQCQDDEKSL
jgi:hypothetical protein